MRIRSSLLLFTLATFILVGCDSSGLDDDDPVQPARAVYVANQGNFGDGNGSVSIYEPDDGTVDPSAIAQLNSIIQGITLHEERVFIASNTGNRVDVFSTTDLSQTAQLTGFTGPRYVAVRDDQAYVTDQPPFGSSRPSQVRVVDLSGGTPAVTDSIAVSGTAEAITTAGDRIYASVGAFGSSTLVAAIDALDNTLAEEIDVSCASRYLATDSDNDVFVLCSDAAEAVILDGTTGAEQNRLALPDTAETLFGIGQAAYYAESSQELYVTTDTGIIRIDTEANAGATLLDVGTGTPITAVAYDAGREELYVGRTPVPPAGFTQQGSVTIHDRSGAAVDSFQVGIAPVFIDLQRQP